MQIRRTQQGFTLIELLIVIAIIGLLATLAIVSLTTAQRKARDTKRIADVKQLQNAVELFYSENSYYPAVTAATANYTWALFGTSIGSYITNVPIDPTNNDSTSYVYTYGANNTATVTSANQYFIGAKLEDTTHTALNGDDDALYSNALTGWTAGGFDFVESDDAANEVLTTFDCGTTVADSTGGVYCASE